MKNSLCLQLSKILLFTYKIPSCSCGSGLWPRGSIFECSIATKKLPFLHELLSLWALLCCPPPPYVKFKARGMMNEAFFSSNVSHSFMAGKEVFLFPRAYSLQLIRGFNNIILRSGILTQQQSVNFSHRHREICHVH